MTKKMRFICLWGCPLGWYSFTTLMVFILLCSVSFPSGGQLSFYAQGLPKHLPSPLFEEVDTLVAEDWVDPLLEEHIEEASFQEERAQEWREYLLFLRENPLNINTLTQEDLEKIGILSPLAVRNFFIERHRRGGVFYSLADLKQINGWDSRSLRKIYPYLTVAPLPENLSEGWNRRGSVGRIHWGLTAFQKKEMDEEAPHLGAPISLRGRVLYGQKGLYSLGLMAASSAFEPLLQAGYPAFDRYSFHASFSLPRHNIHKLVVGDYRLSLGEGLLAHQHFLNSLYSTSAASSARGTVFRETLTNDAAHSLRGLAVEWGGENLRSAFFFSSKVRDARYHPEGVYSLVLDGMHRTEKEWADRDNLKEISWGGSLRYRRERMLLGLNVLTSSWREGALRFLPGYALIRQNAPIDRWSNLSLNYRYQALSGRFASMGEIAWSSNRAWAAVGRMIVRTLSSGEYTLVARYLDPNYAALYAKAPTHFALPGNEWGLFLEGLFPHMGRFQPRFSLDYYASIEPRFHQKEQTKGVRMEISSLYRLRSNALLNILLRYQKEQGETTLFYGRGELVLAPSQAERYTLFVRHRRVADFSSGISTNGWGIGLKGDKKTFAKGRYGWLLAWFSSTDFEGRVWLPIHQPSWEYRSSMFQGKGFYGDFYLRLPLLSHFLLEGKVAYLLPQSSEEHLAPNRRGWEASVALQATF